MNQEEISLKLGLDGSSFAQGVRSIKGQISDFSETSGKAFTKGASAAKGFKQALHEISDTSPILGAALKLAISPIGGMIIAATMAFSYFKNKIEETNKELDRLGDLAAKGFGDMHEAARKARDEVDSLRRSFRDWWNDYAKAHEDVTGGLKQQVDSMDEQASLNDKLLAQEKEKALAAIKYKESTGAISPYQAAVQSHGVEQQYADKKHAQEMADATAKRDILLDAAADLHKQRDAALKPVMEAQARVQENVNARTTNLPMALRDLNSDRDEARKALAKAQAEKENADQDARERTGPYFSAGTMRVYSSPAERQREADNQVELARTGLTGLTKAIKETEDQIRERGEKEKDLVSDLKDKQQEAKKIDDAYFATAKAANAASLKLDLLSKIKPFVAPVGPNPELQPFAPGLDQIAKTRGPYQYAAGRAETLGNQITQRLIQGDFTGAEELKKQRDKLMEGEDVPEVIAGNFGKETHGPKGANAQEEWNRLHGIDYKTGKLVKRGGLDRLLHPNQQTDYAKDSYDLWAKVIKDGKVRVQPSLDN